MSSLPKIDYVLNPTSQLAAAFSILPGLIFFTVFPDELSRDACFLAIPSEHITGESREVETFISVLFSGIIQALQHRRDDLTIFAENLNKYLSHGCRAWVTGVSGKKSLSELKGNFYSEKVQQYEPAALQVLYKQIPDH
jgi:hypothetical protein